MWIGELMGRVLWAVDEPYLRFVGGMVATGYSVVTVFRGARFFVIPQRTDRSGGT